MTCPVFYLRPRRPPSAVRSHSSLRSFLLDPRPHRYGKSSPIRRTFSPAVVRLKPFQIKMASLSRKRGRSFDDDDDSSTDGGVAVILCSGCHADVSFGSHAQLIRGRGVSAEGCEHRMCMQCFGAAQAERSCDINLRCRNAR